MRRQQFGGALNVPESRHQCIRADLPQAEKSHPLQSMQCTRGRQCSSCRIEASNIFLHFSLGRCCSASFQCQTICSLWKGRWAPQAVSSGQLWLNGRRHSSSSRSAAFLHPNTRAAAAACWCSRQGGQEEAQAAPGEQRGTAQKTPLLPSTRFVPPVLPVSGDSGGLSFFPWRDHAAVMGGQGQGHRHTVCLDAQMGANKARRR